MEITNDEIYSSSIEYNNHNFKVFKSIWASFKKKKLYVLEHLEIMVNYIQIHSYLHLVSGYNLLYVLNIYRT